MFESIALYVLIFALGGCIGAAIVTKYLEKSTLDLIHAYQSFIHTFWILINQIYRTLVSLRDSGTENLDEAIACLGELIDKWDEVDDDKED